MLVALERERERDRERRGITSLFQLGLGWHPTGYGSVEKIDLVEEVDRTHLHARPTF